MGPASIMTVIAVVPPSEKHAVGILKPILDSIRKDTLVWVLVTGKITDKFATSIGGLRNICSVFELPSGPERIGGLKWVFEQTTTKFVAIFSGLYSFQPRWEERAAYSFQLHNKVVGLSPINLAPCNTEYESYGGNVVIWRRKTLIKDDGRGLILFGLRGKDVITLGFADVQLKFTWGTKRKNRYAKWAWLKREDVPAPFYADWAQASADIVIPVYGCLTDTERCLLNLHQSIDGLGTVYVVNDGSTKDNKQLMESCGKYGFHFMENVKGQGFPSSCNLGWKAGASEHVCFLNTDTIPAPNWLALLLGYMLTDCLCGAVGPSTSRTSMKQKIKKYMDKRFAMKDMDVILAGQEVFIKYKPRITSCELSGFCFLTRRTLLNRFDGFNETFQLGYGEENFYQSQIKSIGYRPKWVKYAYVHHLGGKSFKTVDRNVVRNLRGMNRRKLMVLRRQLKIQQGNM